MFYAQLIFRDFWHLTPTELLLFLSCCRCLLSWLKNFVDFSKDNQIIFHFQHAYCALYMALANSASVLAYIPYCIVLLATTYDARQQKNCGCPPVVDVYTMSSFIHNQNCFRGRHSYKTFTSFYIHVWLYFGMQKEILPGWSGSLMFWGENHHMLHILMTTQAETLCLWLITMWTMWDFCPCLLQFKKVDLFWSDN